MALFPLGILSAAGAGGGAAGDYELIQTALVSSSTPSVVFSNLDTFSATYKHLQIRATARTTSTSGSGNFLYIRANGISTTTYDFHQLNGSGSSVSSSAAINETGIIIQRASSSVNTANTFGAFVTDILDPFSTTKNKTFRTLGGNTALTRIDLTSGLWRNTAAIVSLTITSESGNLDTGSRFSLYGIRG